MSLIKLSDPVYFGGVNLLTVPGLTITGYDPFRYPKRNVTGFDLAHADKGVTTSGHFGSKMVNVRGIIARSGREDLDDSIAELRRILDPVNQVLQLPISGEQRTFTGVTVGNIGLQDVAGGYIKVDIEFICSDPYNYSPNLTEVLGIVNLTSGNKSYPVTFAGKANQLPIIRYSIDSVTNATNKTVSFINPQMSQTLAVERTWVLGEELIVDCQNQTVEVNGEAVDFTGNFLEWLPTVGHFNYTDDFTARQVDLNVSYYKRYA